MVRFINVNTKNFNILVLFPLISCLSFIVTKKTVGQELVVSTDSIKLGYNSRSSDTFNISSNISWNIAYDAGWFEVTPTSGSNDTTITVIANTTNIEMVPRIGTITISGSETQTHTISVIQENIPIQNPVHLSPGSPPINAEINAAGDEDWYALGSVSSSGPNRYVIRTYGNTDTYMRFYDYSRFSDEHSYLILLDEDDNSGKDNNAIIATNPITSYRYNSYYVKVTGSTPNVIGDYSIDVNFCDGVTDVYSSVSANQSRLAMLVGNGYYTSEAINSISIYHNGGSGNVMLGVYSDDSGSPSSLLSVTEPIPVNANEGWQTIQLANPVILPPNNGEIVAPSNVIVAPSYTVWLAWVFEDNPGARYKEDSSSAYVKQSLGGWSEGMPETFGDANSTNPFSVFYTFTLNPINTIEFDNTGSTESFTISLKKSWSIDHNFPANLKFSSTSGEAGEDIVISVTAPENVSTDSLSGTLTITKENGTYHRISLSQPGSCNLSASTNDIEIDHTGNTDVFTFNCNDNWTIDYDFPGTLELSSISGGPGGDISVSIVASANNSVNSIFGTLSITSECGDEQKLSIEQLGIPVGNLDFEIVSLKYYPNPFSEDFHIEILSTKNEFAKIEIHDIQGRKIKSINVNCTNGINTVGWDGKDGNGNQVKTGIYFINLKMGEYTDNYKVIYVKR